MSDLKTIAGGDPEETQALKYADDIADTLRREVLLVLGHSPDYRGDLTADVTQSHQHNQELAATIGRCTLRALNQHKRRLN